MKTWVLTSRKQVRFNHHIYGLEQWRTNTGLSLEIEPSKPTVRLPVCPQSGFHPKLSFQEGTWWLNMRLLGTLVADKRDLGWAHHDGRPNDIWECMWRVTDRSLMIGTTKRHLFGRFGWCVQYVSILVTRFSGFSHAISALWFRQKLRELGLKSVHVRLEVPVQFGHACLPNSGLDTDQDQQ